MIRTGLYSFFAVALLTVGVAYLCPKCLSGFTNLITTGSWDTKDESSVGVVVVYLARVYGPFVLIFLATIRVAYVSIFGNKRDA